MASTKGDGRAASGRQGEEAAQELLERRGFRIVDTNIRFGKTRGLTGELDIVAWDGPTLCFVEVKTRRTGGQAAAAAAVAPGEAVTPAKQRQITRLAMAYAARHELSDDIPLRFDVVTVLLTPGDAGTVRRADLYRGAFLASDDAAAAE